MKLPRDLSGDSLVKALRQFGYEATRQAGSHIRLTTSQRGEHHVVIPRHTPLRIGTLAAILRDVENHFGLTRQELLARITEPRHG
jgi:predicted RNA binding protein YcfA (HicA-like mRNA interferase family)